MSKIITYCLILFYLMIFAGCDKTADRTAYNILNKARVSYDKQNYSLAAKQLTALLNNDLSVGIRSEAYYLRGLAYMEAGNNKNDLAFSDLAMAVRVGTDSRLKALANVALAHICFEKSPPASDQAIVYYKDSLQAGVTDLPLDIIYYRLAVSLQRIGQWQQAQKYFDRCVTEFPGSKYAALSGKQRNADHYSLQAGIFESYEDAAVMMKFLNKQNWPVRIEKTVINEISNYVVLTGNYQTYNSAAMHLDELLPIESQAAITTDN